MYVYPLLLSNNNQYIASTSTWYKSWHTRLKYIHESRQTEIAVEAVYATIKMLWLD